MTERTKNIIGLLFGLSIILILVILIAGASISPFESYMLYGE